MAQSKEMISRARQLRHDMTKEERHLWYDFLRVYVPRFTRQKIVEPYISGLLLLCRWISC